MDLAWEALLDAEGKQSRKINGEIRRYTSMTRIRRRLSLMPVVCSIKESLRKKFAKAANDFEQKLRSISSQISSMVGSLEVGPQSAFTSNIRLIYVNIRASKIK